MPDLVDSYNRRIDYLRLSVTDHCNYRCFYCRPRVDADTASRGEFLDFSEITRLVRLFTELGVSKLRLTGGEPLVRRKLVDLVGQLRQLPGLDDISLSTNGHLLGRFAAELKAAGVGRVNISLDSIEAENFRRITRNGDLDAVSQGIEAAMAAGMAPIKLNMVVMRGVNDHEIDAMLDYALERGLELRFIETMPVGEAGHRVMDLHYPAAQILQRIQKRFGSRLIPVKGGRGAGPARYYQLANGPARVGVISAVSRHFCEGCNRVRLTARGELVLCLGREDRVSLHESLRAGCSDEEIRRQIMEAIANKPKQHDFQRQEKQVIALRSMSSLGG